MKYIINLFRNDENGTSLVEFALVIIILLTVIFGIINFGWIFHGYITLTGAAREGVRLAVVNADNDDIEGAIIKHAKIFKLTSDNIVISSAAFDEERSVFVSGDLDLLITFPPFPEFVHLEAYATMRQEQ